MSHFNLTCPVSGSQNCEVVLEIPDVPVLSNVLCDSKAEALAVPRGDLVLAFCHDSGHVFNAAFDPGVVEYSGRYENSLHHSDRFQKYALETVDRLIARYNINNKHVVDVGCGDGEFLRLVCDRGANTGDGFDPSYQGIQSSSGSVRIKPETFSKAKLESVPSLIACRHVLEHVEAPRHFLSTILDAADNEYGAVVYIEVPNFGYTLRELAIWDLIYEHFSYFTPTSLSYLFQSTGFDVQDLSTRYGDQFLGIEAVPTVKANGVFVPQVDTTDLTTDVQSFGTKYKATVSAWRRRVEDLRKRSQRAVVWGAGSKGVSLMNLMRAEDVFQFAVDINPRKSGKYVAGAGQEIVHPRQLTSIEPDLVVIMNGLYEEEIKAVLHQMDIHPAIETV